MICNQLMEATNALIKLNPQPSILDVTRSICGCCDRIDSCPSLSIEQAEKIITQKKAMSHVERQNSKRLG